MCSQLYQVGGRLAGHAGCCFGAMRRRSSHADAMRRHRTSPISRRGGWPAHTNCALDIARRPAPGAAARQMRTRAGGMPKLVACRRTRPRRDPLQLDGRQDSCGARPRLLDDMPMTHVGGSPHVGLAKSVTASHKIIPNPKSVPATFTLSLMLVNRQRPSAET